MILSIVTTNSDRSHKDDKWSLAHRRGESDGEGRSLAVVMGLEMFILRIQRQRHKKTGMYYEGNKH